jgi:single-strand DNA-binding protein
MGVNTVAIAGNLTRDGEVKYTSSGLAILRFSIAYNEYRKAKEGGEKPESIVHFFDCVMFGSRAESLGQYLTKGTKVFVSGQLSQSRWEQEGQKRSKVEIKVDGLEFGGGRRQEGGQAPPGRDAFGGEAQEGPAPAGKGDGFEDDIPF